jgi:hypothetical protein
MSFFWLGDYCNLGKEMYSIIDTLSVHHPPAGRPAPHTKLKTFLHEVLHPAPWPAMDHTELPTIQSPHAPYTDHPLKT